MTQEKPQSGELKIRESRTRKLAYTPEFKGILKLDKHVFKKFLELSKRLNSRWDMASDLNIKVTLVNIYVTIDDEFAYYYKVETGSSSFFVKRTPPEYGGGGGFGEILALNKAKTVLRNNKIDWAEVVDFKLGYENEEYRYYVSTWDDRFATRLMDYIDKLRIEKKDKEREELQEKERRLKKILSDFYDVRAFNMSYDPQTKKIYVFDLELKPSKYK